MAVCRMDEMTMRPLSPPLSVIEENLFGPSPELLLQLARAPGTVPPGLRAAVEAEPRYAETLDALRQPDPVTIDPETPAPEMPAWLRERIAQRCQARAAHFPSQPAPGQIRLVEQVIGPHGPLDWDLPRPLAICLDSPYPECRDLWYGWLVTSETDYATYWDVLLEETDEPCDPLAGMIQLWNPTYCYLPSARRVVGQLSAERLAAVRAVAAEFLSGEAPDVTARPGRIAARETLGQRVVTTGTPLGAADDPRWRYRTLYQAALAALREPVNQALDAAREQALQPGWLDRLLKGLEQLAPGLWAPGPALGHAMSEADDGPRVVEGEVAGRVRLRAEVVGEGLMTLVVQLLGEEPLRFKLIGDGQELEDHRLDPRHTTQTLDLDMALSYRLHLLTADNKDIVCIDLPEAGA